MKDQSYLVTGGTGTFGHAFVRYALDHDVRRIRVLSRDELKQHEMRLAFPDPRLEFFLGDVRDRQRLRLAFSSHPDVIIHAAALKQVPACDYNPDEAVATNVTGAQNVLAAARELQVPKVILLSSDKACDPCTTYGKTKALAECLFVQSNAYSSATRSAVVRYGNVVGSRGSVIPLWLHQASHAQSLTVTHPEATRFWWSIDAAVKFVVDALDEMQGGEIFVPKLQSAMLRDICNGIVPHALLETCGLRAGEKMHELMISREESHHTIVDGERFVIQPSDPQWLYEPRGLAVQADTERDWCYSSEDEVRAVVSVSASEVVLA